MPQPPQIDRAKGGACAVVACVFAISTPRSRTRLAGPALGGRGAGSACIAAGVGRWGTREQDGENANGETGCPSHRWCLSRLPRPGTHATRPHAPARRASRPSPAIPPHRRSCHSFSSHARPKHRRSTTTPFNSLITPPLAWGASVTAARHSTPPSSSFTRCTAAAGTPAARARPRPPPAQPWRPPRRPGRWGRRRPAARVARRA